MPVTPRLWARLVFAVFGILCTLAGLAVIGQTPAKLRTSQVEPDFCSDLLKADSTGYLTVIQAAGGFCLIGPNTAIVPSLTGANLWRGNQDATQAGRTLPFRIVSDPVPDTCTPFEAVIASPSGRIFTCDSAGRWVSPFVVR